MTFQTVRKSSAGRTGAVKAGVSQVAKQAREKDAERTAKSGAAKSGAAASLSAKADAKTVDRLVRSRAGDPRAPTRAPRSDAARDAKLSDAVGISARMAAAPRAGLELGDVASSPLVRNAMTKTIDADHDDIVLPESRSPLKDKPKPAPVKDPGPAAPTETTSERAGELLDDMRNPENLERGESVKAKLGGGVSAAAGVGGKKEISDTLEVKRNEDDTYSITVEGDEARSLIGSLGGKAGRVGLNGGGQVGRNSSHKVELKAKDAKEAKKIIRALQRKALADRAKEQIPGGDLLPDPVTPSEAKLIRSRVTATETTTGTHAGFDGTAGAAEKKLPVTAGADGEVKGNSTVTHRTEFELDDRGEPYPARQIEKRTSKGHEKGSVGLKMGNEDVQGGRSVVEAKRETTHELVFTKHLPKPGTNEKPRDTITMRETNEDSSKSGRDVASEKIVKEQEIDASKIDKLTMQKIWSDMNQKRRAERLNKEVPFVGNAKVTVEDSETDATGGLGPYNAKKKTRTETFEIAKGTGDVWTDRMDTDPERLRGKARPGSVVVKDSAETIEGAGTDGGLGVSVLGTGVEVDADIQKTTPA